MSESANMQKACLLLNQHQVVGLPTETVYGLAARIDSEDAVKKIFAIKRRPFFDPLIVHVANKEQAQKLSQGWILAHDVLAQYFWPGPLTLILNKRPDKVSDMISSGLNTVGLRCPQHDMARGLIEMLGCPLAAPSANLFGKTSPTKAQDVLDAFGDEVFVLDGGPCQVGIESTILEVKSTPFDLKGSLKEGTNKGFFEEPPEIELLLHRKGLISKAEVEGVLTQAGYKVTWLNDEPKSVLDSKVSAPGQVAHHYMPDVPLIMVHKEDFNEKEFKKYEPWLEVELGSEPQLAARNLYAEFRKKAEMKPKHLVFIMDPSVHRGEYWEAVLDRITRASSVKPT